MQKSIRSIAVISAVLIFFVMAFVGWFAGLSPAACCQRALTGAVIAYVIVSLAAKAVIAIVINAIVKSKVDKMIKEENR